LLRRGRLWLNQPRETAGNFPQTMNRAEMLQRLRDTSSVWDVLVIGGGDAEPDQDTMVELIFGPAAKH
jgi:hypothetical protein